MTIGKEVKERILDLLEDLGIDLTEELPFEIELHFETTKRKDKLLTKNPVEYLSARECGSRLKVTKTSNHVKINELLEKLFTKYLYKEDQDINKYLSLITLLSEFGAQNLNLRGKFITDAGAAGIFKALKVNQTLTSIDLGFNTISDIGVEHLGEALKVNHTLTSIGLEDNKIKDIGAQNLSEALKVNHTLTSISLTGNEITDTGAHYLSEALKVNNSLQYLYFGYNEITDKGFDKLLGALKGNSSILKLSIGNDHDNINSYIQRNINIKKYIDKSSYQHKFDPALRKIINLIVGEENLTTAIAGFIKNSSIFDQDGLIEFLSNIPGINEQKKEEIKAAIISNTTRDKLPESPMDSAGYEGWVTFAGSESSSDNSSESDIAGSVLSVSNAVGDFRKIQTQEQTDSEINLVYEEFKNANNESRFFDILGLRDGSRSSIESINVSYKNLLDKYSLKEKGSDIRYQEIIRIIVAAYNNALKDIPDYQNNMIFNCYSNPDNNDNRDHQSAAGIGSYSYDKDDVYGRRVCNSATFENSMSKDYNPSTDHLRTNNANVISTTPTNSNKEESIKCLGSILSCFQKCIPSSSPRRNSSLGNSRSITEKSLFHSSL